MRKTLKRAISLLLAVVMVLGVLPAMAFAAETYVATATTGIPEGKDIAIYSAFGASVFGSVNAGNISPSAATLTEEGGLVVKEGSGAYRFAKNSDGTYYITYGDSYLYAIDSKSMGLSGSAVKGAKWSITATTDGYQIANAEQNYNGKPVYIEYYGSALKLWSYSATNAANYVFAFFELPEGADDDRDGRVGADALPPGDRPADGSKVVIYNHSGPVTAGAVDGASLQAIESTFVDINNIIPGNGALIFDVHVDGEYYTFENNGKFLRTSENASDGSNAEEIFFDEVESDYTKWKLQEVEGGYVITNKIATYKNNPVVIEYFNESFQGWTLGGSIDLYAMRFYEVKDELNLGYVLNPTMKITAQTAYKGLDYEVKVKLDDLTEIKSIKLTASVDGGAEFALTQKSNENYDYIYGVPGSKLTGSKLTIKGTATNEYDMTYTAETIVDISNEPIILSVSPAANEATLEEKRPEISVNIHNCGTKPTVTMKLDEVAVTPTVTASKISYKPTEAMMDGRHVVYVKVVREDGKAV
ncbi:MAG: hypothetical protein IKV47_02625, partial [Oscillospiraceae bacterium]|nr:hypothetical protein [Oscillospiraceae bacterium]